MITKKQQPPKEKSPETPSPSSLRRQREREHRYQTILTAAERLFAVEGYHKTSMEQIANASEVSVGAVYFYFKNKEDLIVQLMDEIGYLLRRTIGSVFLAHGPTLESFKLTGQAFFEDFCVNFPEKCAIIFRESVGQSQEVEARRKALFDKCTGDVLGALKSVAVHQGLTFKGEFSAEVISVSIMGIYERIAYQYLFWQDRSSDLKTIGRDAVEFILGGVANLVNK